jgi:hypothetical protein
MSTVKISDRAGKTITEFLLPNLQENFWRVSKHPMLKAIGFEREETPQKGAGTPLRPRVMVPSVQMGRRFEVEHLHTAFGGGVHAAAEDTSLRTGKFQSDRSFADAKFVQGAFEVTRQAIAATRDKEFALVKEITQNAEGAVHAMHWNLNRMIVGAGSGQLAVVNAGVTASTTINLDHGGTEETPPTQHLNEGDVLLIGTTAEIEAGTAETVTVATITDDNTFEATTNETLADDDIVVRADAYDVSGTAYTEVTGFTNLITNTGTVQNINKANDSWFQSHLDASVGTIALSDIDAMLMKTSRHSKNPADLFMLCNSTQWRRIASLMTVTRNYDVETWKGNLVGGQQGLVYHGPEGKHAIFKDDMVPDGVVWMVDPNSFYWGEMAPFSFAEDALSMDGVPGQRKSGTLNYEFAFYMFGNLAQTNAKASAQLGGITGPAV